MKHKIKHKLAAALVAAASLFCLTIPASAMSGDNTGGSTGDVSYADNTPFSYLGKSDDFAWRADLYVSANADGKIVEPSDDIGSDKLPLVGSLFCTSSNHVSRNGYAVYIQTNYTDRPETRGAFSPTGVLAGGTGEDLGMVQYTLPTLWEFKPSKGTYTDASSHLVVIADSGLKLFDGQWKKASTGTNFKDVQDKLTKDGYETYIKDLLLQLLNKEKVAQDFFDKTFGSINQQIRDKIVTRANNEKISSGDAFKKYLLPVNPTTGEKNKDCMVEWALVLTPLYHFNAMAPIYYGSSCTPTPFNTCVALDAYWLAQYNATSRTLSSNGKYDSAVSAKTAGVLVRWLVENTGAVGSAAYCSQDKDPYLGVFTNVNKNATQLDWYNMLKAQPDQFARRGGIAVFTTKIETPEAPVYYHTYTYRIDENEKDKLPDGYTPGTYSTDHPDLLKFLDDLTEESVTVAKVEAPKDNIIYPKQIAKDKEMPGIVVAAMAPLPSITQPGYVDEYPRYLLLLILTELSNLCTESRMA